VVVIAGVALTLADICLIVLGMSIVACLATPGCPEALMDIVEAIVKGVADLIKRIVDWIKEKCRAGRWACDKCAETVIHLYYGKEETCEIIFQNWVPPCLCKYACETSMEVIILPGTPILL
jgi:hypothetical protein